MNFYLSRHYRNAVDILIEPAVKHIEWTSFLRYSGIVREGERATEPKIDEIQEMLRCGLKTRASHWARQILRVRRKGYQEKFVRSAEAIAPS